MQWEKAEGATIDVDAFYLVQTNDMEWRDHDLIVIRGYLVVRRTQADYVRGRPIWIAKIIRPTT